MGLLIPGSDIGLYSGVNFDRGSIRGFEFTYEATAPKQGGFDAYINGTTSVAKPQGFDNTGAEVPEYNDHDQLYTAGLGLAYTWKSGATFALTLQYGSGLASSVVNADKGRTPRTQVDFRAATSDRTLWGRGGISLDVQNLFDRRDVINFQSAFSGTRFMIGRRITLSTFFKF